LHPANSYLLPVHSAKQGGTFTLMEKLKIRFTWFQPRMNDHYFFENLLKKHYSIELVQDVNEFVNVEFVGVYKPAFGSRRVQLNKYLNRVKSLTIGNETEFTVRGDDHQNDFLLGENSYVPEHLNSKKRIWFSFENVRPPTYIDKFDLTLSTDKDPYFGKNIYFPWIYYILSLNGSVFDTDLGENGSPYEAQDLIKSRKAIGKEESAVMVINNFHPVRMEFAKQLAKIMHVDIYGRAVGKPLDSKYDTVSKYKYMICFENDLFPGWITEKPIHAWMCETVPLYWGEIGPTDILNPKALINVNDFNNLEESLEHIKLLGEDEYASIYSNPILRKFPNMNEIENAILTVAQDSLA
jgi:hypothetical protein